VNFLQYWPEFLTIVVIHLLAVMSPGPDFAMITRNSLVYSRRVGMLSAIGLALGIATHVSYSLVGIGLLISRSIILFSIIKWCGAGYLIYIGWKSLRSKPPPKTIHTLEGTRDDLSNFAAIRLGFFTNILNPKVTLFMLSVFTQVIKSTTPTVIQLMYGMEMAIMTFLWFSFVAIVLSHHLIRRVFQRIQHYIEKVMGAILIALGVKVALEKV
jgi:RhtB (resistance to homoserine/threonine) family protein